MAFYGLAILTIGSSIVALESRELIYWGDSFGNFNARNWVFFFPTLLLLQCFKSQCAGAVAVLVIFTVMLVRLALFSRKKIVDESELY